METRLVAIYTRLLDCLPSGFRDEFSVEMKQVFARRMGEAGSRGRGVMLQVFVEELLTLPRLWLLAYQREMKHFLASLVIFAFIFGVWIIFASLVATSGILPAWGGAGWVGRRWSIDNGPIRRIGIRRPASWENDGPFF